MADPEMRGSLDRLFAGEVVPGFAAHGFGDEAIDYVRHTVTRFANPFLAHRLADIAGSHSAKVDKRVAAFVEWVAQAPRHPELPALTALVQKVRSVAA